MAGPKPAVFLLFEAQKGGTKCAGIVMESGFDKLKIGRRSARCHIHDVFDDEGQQLGASFQNTATE